MKIHKPSHTLLSAALVGWILLVSGCVNSDDPTTAESVAPISSSTTEPPPTATPATTSAPGTTTTSTTTPTATSATESSMLPGLGDPELERQLQGVIDAAVATLPTPEATIQAAVLRGSTGESWSGAAGQDGEPFRPFRMASVGKTFTAVAILRLVEDEAFTLDDTIDGLLSPDTAALLAGDGYRLSEITVSQLLHHTAGFYDYGFGEGSPFLNRALTDFTHVWTRAEQLQLAVDVGDPLAAPGVEFHYDDTGYVLLGEIIEQTTSKPYAVAMRELLDYDGLGLDQVWLESGEPAPSDALSLSRSFFGTTEISDLDFSIDAFGGGGLAGTSIDIAHFFDSLLQGKVFHDAATLDLMLEIPATNVGLQEFGIPLGDGANGLYRIDIAGNTCWNHRGFLGTIAITCPAADITVVVTTNSANTEPLPIATALIIAAGR